jgi:C_GCAxxG_C_C family probable redox protein
MSTKENKALEYFRSGLNCAQSVLMASAEDLIPNKEFLEGISCGFGGGMGRLQETCGAVTGAFMAIGLNNRAKINDNAELKEVTYSMVRKFNHQFKSLNGSTDCQVLLNCDLKTEEGRKYAHDHQLFEKICEKCITDSVRILNEMME